VTYDHKLTLIMRDIDEEMAKDVLPMILPDEHPVMAVNNFIRAAFELAQSEETWTEGNKRAWEEFVRKSKEAWEG